MTDVDSPLEDREVRPRRDHCGLVQENAGARRDQKERSGESGDERKRTSRPPLWKRRHGHERHERGRMRVVDRITNLGEGGRDDLEIDVSEHVLGFARGCLVERIGHCERGARASELDEDDGAELAEAARKLTYDGGLGGTSERHHRVASDASECVRERVRRNEARSQDGVGESLLALARAIEVLDLPRGEELFGNEELGELGLCAHRLVYLWLRRRNAGRGADDTHDLLRGLVL